MRASRVIKGVASGLGMVGGYLVWLATVMLVVAAFPVEAWAAAGVTGLILLAVTAFWFARCSANAAVRRALWWSPALPVLACVYLTVVVLT